MKDTLSAIHSSSSSAGRAILFFAAVVLLLTLSSACGGNGGGSNGDLDLLRSNRILWQRQTRTSYTYVIRRDCFCAFAGERIRVTVRDNHVTGAQSLESGRQIDRPGETFSTIDELFQSLEQTLEDTPASFNAAYDPVMGYPASVSIDSDALSVDDELSYTVAVENG